MSKAQPPKASVVPSSDRDAAAVTISASIPAAEAAALEAVMKGTQWHRSRVVANALALYAAFAPEALHQLASLQERVGADRVRDAVVESVERALDRLEWDALAEATSRELEGRLPEELPEKQLVKYGRTAIAASRAARRARPVGKVSERTKTDWGRTRPKGR